MSICPGGVEAGLYDLYEGDSVQEFTVEGKTAFWIDSNVLAGNHHLSDMGRMRMGKVPGSTDPGPVKTEY
jgi:hypothetical protein